MIEKFYGKKDQKSFRFQSIVKYCYNRKHIAPLSRGFLKIAEKALGKLSRKWIRDADDNALEKKLI